MEPYYDSEIEGLVVHKTSEWIVSIHRMLYSDRIILTNVNEYPNTYTAGWDYEVNGALLQALMWDPEDEWEPKGYIRCACDSRTR